MPLIQLGTMASVRRRRQGRVKTEDDVDDDDANPAPINAILCGCHRLARKRTKHNYALLNIKMKQPQRSMLVYSQRMRYVRHIHSIPSALAQLLIWHRFFPSLVIIISYFCRHECASVCFPLVAIVSINDKNCE